MGATAELGLPQSLTLAGGQGINACPQHTMLGERHFSKAGPAPGAVSLSSLGPTPGAGQSHSTC